ncbi:MAG: DUF503 domain-containing protein [Deltaproteobacteria bacterium HGW-Deltaproteobacteria-13]|jgi:hypothetical protein|nr:MAG: DUF503 domain-containing protein [Deltaproteobacteria bacterium HGW-Deltaproteobacteria-13]
MVIGYGIINLRIPESGSLKEKRSVLNKILKRAQNEFNVTIAETGALDHLLRFIENLQVAEILDSKTEIMVVSSFLEAADWKTSKYDEL